MFPRPPPHRSSQDRLGRLKWTIVSIAGFALGGLRMLGAEAPAAGAGDQASIDAARLLFDQHCQKCHSGEKAKGDFEIASLSPDFADRKNREQWLSVLEKLKSGAMPPKAKPRPPAEEVRTVVHWIDERASAAKAPKPIRPRVGQFSEGASRPVRLERPWRAAHSPHDPSECGRTHPSRVFGPSASSISPDISPFEQKVSEVPAVSRQG
jgi:mono/diheme cytochrome c family protein